MSVKIKEDELKIIQLIHQEGDMSQRKISNSLGISLGKINYCIASLIDVGYIKIKTFGSSNNKLNYYYLVTPKGLKEKTIATKQFLKQKKVEYDMLANSLNNNNKN